MKSLSKHIFSSIAIASIAVLILLDVFIWNQIKLSLIDNIKRETHEKVNLARKVLNKNDFIHNNTNSLKAFSDEIKSLTGLRATLINREGLVLSDSDVEIEKLSEVKNHLHRPEVQAALKTNSGYAIRRSATINRELIYYCETLKDNGRVIGFIRFAIFAEDFSNQMNFTIFILVISNLFILLIVFGFGYLYWKQLKKQFVTFESALGGIKDRKSFTPISPQEYNEFDRLASLTNSVGEKFQNEYTLISNQRDDLNSIFDSLSEGVAAFDSYGLLTFINSAFCNVMGVEVEKGKRYHYYDIVEFPPLIKDLANFEKNKKPIKNRSKYYGHKFIEYNIVELKSSENNDKGLVITVEDVTQLQELETVRTDFVANVSHEFKTPLTSIKGYAETLQMGAVNNPELSIKFLKKIENQAAHLENMVMDLLSLTRIERESLIEFEDIEIVPIIKDLVEDFIPQAENLGQKISFESSIKKSAIINANPFLIQNIVSNLISNALRYNKKNGTVEIALSCDENSVLFEVKDYGIGITEKEQKRIFERFYRVEEAKNIFVEGSGLGLSIVKHAVELLNAEIKLESQEGKGAKFSVVIPKVNSREE